MSRIHHSEIGYDKIIRCKGRTFLYLSRKFENQSSETTINGVTDSPRAEQIGIKLALPKDFVQ
ncbi:2207_t:CDS:2 [Rhizophagus irregularis]|nr:2207_t:CDS:2 [Rhizophagus irregularis]